MKNIVLILFGILFGYTSYSQKHQLRVERNLSEFIVDTTFYCQINYLYTNTSDSVYVLWIERNDVDSLSNLEKINNHFFTIKGDWSLMGLIWDGNVGNYTPGLFDSFMKVIKPNEHFLVSFIKKGKYGTNYENQIIIVNAEEINGLKINSNIEMFNYSANSVTILAEWLKQKE